MTGIWAHAAGVLVRDPERRSGSRGDFAIATLRIGSADAVQWVNVIAFGEAADRLWTLHAGDGVSVAGRGEIKTWTSRTGEARHGLSVVASEIAAARPRPRDDTARQPARGSMYRQPAQPTPSNIGPELDDRLDDWPAGAP
ncbi:MAG TPA: single-stranded DNA-binding protein [Stellaceae bacterium]|nr:single-stranded DNA-binding protein [Stellaceae bacterium]